MSARALTTTILCQEQVTSEELKVEAALRSVLPAGLAGLLLLSALPTAALDNGVALTPPQAWTSEPTRPCIPTHDPCLTH